jgi:U3 small nucleolar RNA-associated protein 11
MSWCSSFRVSSTSLPGRDQKGVHVISKTKQTSAAVMSKMKLEDQNYLTLKAVEEAKKIDRLQSTLHLGSAPSIAGGGSGSHTLFLDDEDAVKNFDAVEHFDTVPELVGRAHDRPRKSALATARIIGPTDQVCSATGCAHCSGHRFRYG